MKKFLLIITAMLMLSACKPVPDLEDENILTFEVQAATIAPELTAGLEQQPSATPGESLEQRFSELSFIPVSGNFARTTVYEDTPYTELFMPDKNHFLRIAANDLEEEVFAYNYITDDFTYLYYFDGQLLAKTVYNIASGEVKQDDGGFAEYITIDAEELKLYCLEILKRAGISPQEL